MVNVELKSAFCRRHFKPKVDNARRAIPPTILTISMSTQSMKLGSNSQAIHQDYVLGQHLARRTKHNGTELVFGHHRIRAVRLAFVKPFAVRSDLATWIWFASIPLKTYATRQYRNGASRFRRGCGEVQPGADDGDHTQ
jgi:hypothetical protein